MSYPPPLYDGDGEATTWVRRTQAALARAGRLSSPLANTSFGLSMGLGAPALFGVAGAPSPSCSLRGSVTPGNFAQTIAPGRRGEAEDHDQQHLHPIRTD